MPLWAACAVAILGLSSTSAQQSPGTHFVPGELLVSFRAQATEGQRDGHRRAVGSRLLRRFEHSDLEHLKLPANISVAQALRVLRRSPDVLSAAPNYLQYVAASGPPNDPYWLATSPPNLWGMEKINAQAAWTHFGTDSSQVVVGLIDTGTDYNHPDLAANIWSSPRPFTFGGVTCPQGTHGVNAFTSPFTCDPMDDIGHGTLTAGILGGVGNNGIGVAGVNWGVKIMPCKALGPDGAGTSASTIACINFIIDQKVNHGVNVRVINNSWGNYAFDTSVKAAVDAAGAAGILMPFAAGNVGTDNDGPNPFYPASYTSPNIVSVAASDIDDNPAVFGPPYKTNYGATSVDLAAPGAQILSTFSSPHWPGIQYLVMPGGTSYAVPHVSGVAARLAALNPSLTVSELKMILMTSVDRLGQWSDKVVSGGRLNMLAALLSLHRGGGESTATFVRTDTTTQGSWLGVYGSDGYVLADGATALPRYAQVSFAEQQSFTWAASTTDPRALQRPTGGDRIAATWYTDTHFSIDVDITDGALHRVALYNLDWNGANTRAQRVDVLNATTGALLDSRTITAFTNGQYLVWTIGGHVTFRITNTGPTNVTVSGLFFDPGASPSPPTITTSPASQAITSGQTATMSVVATSTAPLAYQWYVGTSGTTTTPIAGATASSYTTPALTNTTSYWVRVSNASGGANSATATITVSSSPPTIATSPASQTIASGQAATMAVVAGGTPPLTYQWYVGTSGTTTTPIAGATASDYTTPALTNTTSYWVRVSNASGSANSATATITVAAAASGRTHAVVSGINFAANTEAPVAAFDLGTGDQLWETYSGDSGWTAGGAPAGVTITADARYTAWPAHRVAGSGVEHGLVVRDATTGAFLTTALAEAPSWLLAHPRALELYAVYPSGRVDVISPATRATLQPCTGVRAAALTLDGARLFIGCDANEVVMISTSTHAVLGTLPTEERIDALAANTDGTRLVVARSPEGLDDGVVSVYDVTTGGLAARTPFPASSEYDTSVTLLRSDVTGARVYLSTLNVHKLRARFDRFSETLVFDTGGLAHVATIPRGFEDIAFSADGSMAVGLEVSRGFVASSVTAYRLDLGTHALWPLASAFAYGHPSVDLAEPPLAPVQLNYSKAGRSVTMSWELPHQSKAVSSWELEVRASADGSLVALLPIATSAQRFHVDAVPPGDYRVRLRGMNAVGPGPWSMPLLVSVP